jgi:hypothetical protein
MPMERDGGHRVVVVEVDDSAAPRFHPDRPSLYITTTAGSAVSRVAQLLTGTRGPEVIRGHVVRDRPDLYARFPPKTARHVNEQREHLVCRLIRRGHRVVGQAHHRVYVIELDPSERYPGFGGTWVYVGQSSRSPEDRFREHTSGARNREDRGRLYNDEVRRWGMRLLPQFYAHLHPSCTAQAEARELALARQLLAKGFKVTSDALTPDERS